MDDRQTLLLEQWRKASELHRHEDSLAWEKVKYFLTVNSGLIAVATLLTNAPSQKLIRIGIALFGALMALIWTLVQRRGRWYHRYRTAQARQAESDLKMDGQQVLSVYTNLAEQQLVAIPDLWRCSLLSIHSLLVRVADLVLIVWLVLLGYFLCGHKG